MARQTALSLAAVLCGPIWLAATQADMVSAMAGALSIYTCNASIAMYLPSLSQQEEAEAAAAAGTLSIVDSMVTVQLDVDLETEEGDGEFGLHSSGGGGSPGDGSLDCAAGDGGGLMVRVKLVAGLGGFTSFTTRFTVDCDTICHVIHYTLYRCSPLSTTFRCVIHPYLLSS
jgi:hypothetical protein